jgi:hypothetical protein
LKEWDDRPRVAEWFMRIKARPSFKAISEYPPTDYGDTGRDGLKKGADRDLSAVNKFAGCQ